MTSQVNVSQGSMYQGYPYTNPRITDVPSINAETAAKWTNLPRKQVVPKQPITNEPTIYLDIPNNGTPGSSSCTTGLSRPDTLNIGANTSKDEDDTPVIYIDLPDSTVSSSSVTRENEMRRPENPNSDNNSGFVEETIFYDPFKDRRIDVGPNRDQPTSGSSSSQAGSSRVIPSQYDSKETYIYGSIESRLNSRQTTVDDYLIPVTEFPNPPPAYSEVDITPAPAPAPTPTPTPIPKPIRTEVIVPNQQIPIGIARSDRKLVSCPHCSARVHTLVVRENACLTHIIAIFFLIVFIPIGILIYCTDYFKYRNHYCPNCNRLIGYEIPIFCQGMTYTKTH